MKTSRFKLPLQARRFWIPVVLLAGQITYASTANACNYFFCKKSAELVQCLKDCDDPKVQDRYKHWSNIFRPNGLIRTAKSYCKEDCKNKFAK